MQEMDQRIAGRRAVLPSAAHGCAAGSTSAPAARRRLPAAAARAMPVCTRASLQAAVDSYLAAQKTGDAQEDGLRREGEVSREHERGRRRTRACGTRRFRSRSTRSFLDRKRCKTFTEIIVTEGGHPYVIGTRLYVDNGKITRIDSLVTDKGDWLFNANDYLKYAEDRELGDRADASSARRCRP